MARFPTLAEARRLAEHRLAPARSDPGTWRPSPLRRALRRPVVYWSFAGLLTLVTVWTVGVLTTTAKATIDSYGPRSSVLVVTAPVAPAEPLDSANVALRDVPSSLVPSGALRSIPVDSMSRVELLPGEVVVRSRLAGEGSGIAGMVPTGATALAVPGGQALPPLVVGDLVDIIATFAAALPDSEEPSFAVARHAAVLHVEDDIVTVAVDAEEVAPVAFAIAHGMVTVAIVG